LSRRCRFRTICGSNVPARPRGTSISTLPRRFGEHRLRPGAGGLDAYRFDDDGWTLRSTDGSRGAHFEHTIAITDHGPIVLTASHAEEKSTASSANELSTDPPDPFR